MSSSHPYTEPSFVSTLVVAGFVLCLNVINNILDVALYCGLIGQIAIGVLFGTPGVKVLGNAFETNITNLGYLGLLLLVYEGGLSTSVSSLISSSLVSFLIATTGVVLPIAMSFLLIPLGASLLQAFAAGAALSATSLGTTLTILSNAGLSNTDLGIVLTSAAMLDDITGLIMLQVISDLSSTGGQPSRQDFGKTIGRPIGASVGLIVLVTIAARFVLLPVYRRVLPWFLSSNRLRIIKDVFLNQSFTFLVHTAILFTIVIIGGFAGTSPLLAAFIAGVTIRWLGEAAALDRSMFTGNDSYRPLSALEVYEHYYQPATERILKPLFFASIGFSIPITQMFRGSVVWKGLIYSLLMFLGKVATGVWLWIFPTPLEPFAHCCSSRPRVRRSPSSITRLDGPTSSRRRYHNVESPPGTPKVNNGDPSSDIQTNLPILSDQAQSSHSREPLPHAPLLLGMAMVARGEIGFLIASVAASKEVFSVANKTPDDDELYLVVVWAITICTIFGPLAVGSLLRHNRSVETRRLAN